MFPVSWSKQKSSHTLPVHIGAVGIRFVDILQSDRIPISTNHRHDTTQLGWRPACHQEDHGTHKEDRLCCCCCNQDRNNYYPIRSSTRWFFVIWFTYEFHVEIIYLKFTRRVYNPEEHLATIKSHLGAYIGIDPLYSSFRGVDHKVLKTSVRPFYLYSIVFNPLASSKRQPTNQPSNLLHFATSNRISTSTALISIDLPLNYNIPIAILVGSRCTGMAPPSTPHHIQHSCTLLYWVVIIVFNLLPHILRKFEQTAPPPPPPTQLW